MPSSASGPVLTSVPAGRLDVTAGINTDIELKFDWEDFEVLSGDRPLIEVLDEASLDPARVASVHLPPGLRTRGREIGMAATEANVGAIVDFVHAQLTDLADPLLVMHPPRTFEYGDQLTLFRTLCDLTGHEISIENQPDASYWHTPEDIAFFAFVGATYDAWADLYVTIDSAHLPAHRPPPDPVDWDAVDELFERFDEGENLDVAAVRKAFGGHLTGTVAEHRPSDVPELPNDGWSPLLNALVLAGERVKGVHFNDPAEDGIPVLDDRRERPSLDPIREILLAQEIAIVLEPDRGLFDRPEALARRTDAVEDWLAGQL